MISFILTITIILVFYTLVAITFSIGILHAELGFMRTVKFITTYNILESFKWHKR